jgi:cation transport regulator ChaC
MWENNAQAVSIISKGSSSQATISQGSMSGMAFNIPSAGNQPRLIHLNDKERAKPIRLDIPRVNKQQKGKYIFKNISF